MGFAQKNLAHLPNSWRGTYVPNFKKIRVGGCRGSVFWDLYCIILLILSIIDYVIDQLYTSNISLAKASGSYQLDKSLLQHCQLSKKSVPWYRNYRHMNEQTHFNHFRTNFWPISAPCAQIFGQFFKIWWKFIHALVLYTKC